MGNRRSQKARYGKEYSMFEQDYIMRLIREMARAILLRPVFTPRTLKFARASDKKAIKELNI